jgi:hypothetical protein
MIMSVSPFTDDCMQLACQLFRHQQGFETPSCSFLVRPGLAASDLSEPFMRGRLLALILLGQIPRGF